jgi:hypothetical protein
MSEKIIPMNLPLDSDGFLRRQCSSCERQFKWHPNQQETALDRDDGLIAETLGEDDKDSYPNPEYYYCPYCREPATPDAWWTKEQLEYGKSLAAAEILGPQLRDFADSLKGMNSRGGLISFSVDVDMPDLSRPEPLTEPDDMLRVDFPCHPEEPVKIEEGWGSEVACLVCSILYPVDLVREMPAHD